MVKREGFGNRLEKTKETSEHSKAQREKYLSCPFDCLNLGLCFRRRSTQVCEKLCCTSSTDPPTQNNSRE